MTRTTDAAAHDPETIHRLADEITRLRAERDAAVKRAEEEVAMLRDELAQAKRDLDAFRAALGEGQ